MSAHRSIRLQAASATVILLVVAVTGAVNAEATDHVNGFDDGVGTRLDPPTRCAFGLVGVPLASSSIREPWSVPHSSNDQAGCVNVPRVAGTAPGSRPPSGWSIRDLDTLGGPWSEARALNERGQVVGLSRINYSDQELPPFRAFSWTMQGGMVNLGTLGSPGASSYAQAVNNSGEVVGDSELGYDSGLQAFAWTRHSGLASLGGGDISYAHAVNARGMVVGGNEIDYYEQYHALAWTPQGKVIDLGALLPGVTTSGALAVNDRGEVVGWADPSCAYPCARRVYVFSWTRSGGMAEVGGLGGYAAYPEGINNHGRIVGSGSLPHHVSRYHAFTWTAREGLVDLGTLGGYSSGPSALNNHGAVIGTSQTASGRSHAFLWTAPKGMIDLGTLGGRNSGAAAINDHGEVVGTSQTANGQWHAFDWTPQTGMIDLGTLGRDYSDAIAVNNRGEVIGSSITRRGQYHAVLWSRTPPT